MTRLWILGVIAVLIVAITPVAAQPVAPSKSGMITEAQGEAFLDNEPLPEPSPAQFPYLKEQSALRTAEGRVEITMNPGLLMHVGGNSALRMLDARFIDTRVELIQGAAVAQWAEVLSENHFTLVLKDAVVKIAKAGVYRFDVEPARVKVFSGAAQVQVAGQTLSVAAGKMLDLTGGVASLSKFEKTDTDALDAWSISRAELQAAANASAAREMYGSYGKLDPCYGQKVAPGAPCRGTWRYNPWYGLWTYIAMGDRVCDPFTGVCLYSPYGAYNAYYRPPIAMPPPLNSGSVFPSTMPTTSSGSSGAAAASSVSMSSPSAGSGSTAGAAASTVSVGHGSAGGGGRGR